MQYKGFLGTLFDFSFSEFITTKVIKFILGLAMVVNAILTIVFIVGAFQTGWLGGIIVLILSPLLYLIMMLISRIYLELIIVIFRIAENLIAIRDKLGAPDIEITGEDATNA
jgi:sensor histidine kinase YesM